MENLITIKSDYSSQDSLYAILKTISFYECIMDYDIWEQRIDNNGQLKQCIILKKNSMHAIKIFFVNENTVKVNHIIPNKMMNAYFGKSVKARRNIIEILAGLIKQVVLKGSQKKAFKELENVVKKVAA